MLVWLVWIGGALALGLAWAIGAQDVSNTFGTSVGSEAVSVPVACVLAAICEFGGSILGGNVASRLAGGILDVPWYVAEGKDGARLYALVMVCAMFGALGWLIIATRLSLPVSTSHSLVGGLVGLGMVTSGSVNWWSVLLLASSWITSPLLGGILSYTTFSLLQYSLLTTPDPIASANTYLPSISSYTIGILCFMLLRLGPTSSVLSPLQSLLLSASLSFLLLLLSSKTTLTLSLHPTLQPLHPYLSILRTLLGGDPRTEVEETAESEGEVEMVAAVGKGVGEEGVGFDVSVDDVDVLEEAENGAVVVMAATRRSSRGESVGDEKDGGGGGDEKDGGGSGGDVDVVGEEDGLLAEQRPPVASPHGVSSSESGSDAGGGKVLAVEVVERRFIPLLLLTACVLSVAHGSNDVSNAVAPFSAILAVYRSRHIDLSASVPLWLLAGAGLFIVVGLATYGYKVMATVGTKITKLTFSRGFTVQFSTALTVLTASQLALSISTTHVLVGAIAGVGLVSGRDAVNRDTLKQIALSWVVTLPAAAAIALLCFYATQLF